MGESALSLNMALAERILYARAAPAVYLVGCAARTQIREAPARSTEGHNACQRLKRNGINGIITSFAGAVPGSGRSSHQLFWDRRLAQYALMRLETSFRSSSGMLFLPLGLRGLKNDCC